MVILANSPQVKGPVDRTFGRAQDLLIKGMCSAWITTLEEAKPLLGGAVDSVL